MEVKSLSKIDKSTYFLSKKVGMAIADYAMLQDNDKILVAVSGGKDSFTLLRMLKYRQTFVPIHFEILAVHVDMGFAQTSQEFLRQYCEQEGIPFLVEKPPIDQEKILDDLNCFWCSWNRRKTLFQLAEQKGFNKIALGHHRDDIIETILLNMFYQGSISAMTPKQEFFGGKLTVIRPLAYLEEKEIKRYVSKIDNFSFGSCSCPQQDLSKRKFVKNLIFELEKDNPHIKKNIFQSVKRIKSEYLL